MRSAHGCSLRDCDAKDSPKEDEERAALVVAERDCKYRDGKERAVLCNRAKNSPHCKKVM